MKTKLFHVPRFVKWIYPHQVWSFDSPNEVFLTFDDGPHPIITPRLLKLLDEYEVKATFFLLGENVEKYPELHAAIAEKHQIGNHGYRHLNCHETTEEGYFQNYLDGKRFQTINYFRPPYGKISKVMAKKIGQDSRLAMWTWLSYDYDSDCSLAMIQKNLEKHLKPGDIMVYHENDKTVERFELLVKQAINFVKSKGYTFGQFPTKD